MVGTVSTRQRWTADLLQEMRSVGDPMADEAIRLWLESQSSVGQKGPGHAEGDALKDLAHKLVGFESGTTVDALIEQLVILKAHSALDIDPGRRPDYGCADQDLALTRELFREHGLKILMILVFYSLPAAYAAQNGVRVLHSDNGGTGYLVTDLNRRLIETTQFVVEICSTDGLRIAPGGSFAAHGPAVRSALRVRLLHAAVRALIQRHKPAWDGKTLGVPANQEDVAGALMTFSLLVVDGMRKLSLGVHPATEAAYFNVWRAVGRILGVDDRLIPADLAEATALMDQIKARQIDAPIREHATNHMGIQMTRHLLDFIRQTLPPPLRPFRRLPASVMRFFLPSTPVDVPRSLGIPRTFGLDEAVRLWFFLEAHVTTYALFDRLNRAVYKEWGGRDTRVRSLLQFSRFFNRRLVTTVQQVDRNVPLAVPKTADGTPSHVDLFGWDKEWALSQADFIVRSARQVSARLKPKS